MSISLVPLLSIGKKRAIELTWRLLEERPQKANISHFYMPSMRKHKEFLLDPPYNEWCAIKNQDGVPVGTILVTRRNEIGVAILKEHQRQGYAEAAIKLLMATYKPATGVPSQRADHFVANVAPTNEASIALFNKLGKVIQWTYKL